MLRFVTASLCLCCVFVSSPLLHAEEACPASTDTVTVPKNKGLNAAEAQPLSPDRLHRDWMYQDYGLNIDNCFATPSSVVFNDLTDDTSTGFAVNKTYTHLLDYGKEGVAEGAKINGVQFQKTAAAAGTSIINGTTTSYGWKGGLSNPFGNFADDPAVAKSSGLQNLLSDCNYGQDTAMQLTGLTPGKTYEVRIYCRKYNNEDRTFPISFDAGENGKASISYDYNKRTPHALTYRYIPKGTTLTVHFGKAKGNYDINALTNEELPAGTPIFAGAKDSSIESAMVQKVLAEINDNSQAAEYRSQLQKLQDVSGNDPRWKELYINVCGLRRTQRLASLVKSQNGGNSANIIYTKHCVLSGPCQMHPTDMVTDHPYKEQIPDFRPGAQLRMLTVGTDGSLTDTLLLEKPNGMIRDPNLSFDAKKIVFSMREDYKSDDFHLYIMDLADRNVTQITRGEACSDVEPAFLPDGNIVFQSTRCVQIVDCWPVPVSNLYICAADGAYLHRVGFDQVHTLYPQVLDNGTVIYTRWEYNDRNPVHQQPLFQMNLDGTAQTAFYGGGSYYPTSIIHARGIPGTNKVIAVASGHHTDQRGKLILIDRSRGTEGNAGIDFPAPLRKSEIPVTTKSIFKMNDQFGQDGEQFQYPAAIDENNYVVAYLPEGGPRAKYPIPFGVYWMNADGRRELLAYDSAISCGQPIPLVARAVPSVKPSQVDFSQNTGKYYVQDIYIGQGLTGVKRGTVKSMRVVGLEFRAGHVRDGITDGRNTAYGARGSRDRVTTPIAAGSGSWDVKHVLGEVPVEEDGSVYVEVPARTPVYFQLLDEKGYCVQTMRSWTTLQPGETFACIGCHEDKNISVTASQTTLAMRKPVQKLAAVSALDSVDSYLSVNSPKGFDRVEGFSYTKQIQPIWDKHCVSCHNGGKEPEMKQVSFKKSDVKTSELDLRGVVHENLKNDFIGKSEHSWQVNGRAYLTSYLQLTNYGVSGKHINWTDAESIPMVLPPYFNGSSKSGLMNFLEPAHYKVSLTPAEKRLAACWIDLCVPFCGAYTEANEWTDEQKSLYQYFEAKRTKFAEIEIDHLRTRLGKR
ncbi:MAG: hypothetical protein LBT46_07460 [Planctomycetaceae bacterium]|jgi:hypothetical protein|nr:hypothetical protein [Planctomycetaceae bacterium]